MNHTRIAASVALAVLASACGNTADGAKKDAEKIANKTASAAATAGAAIDAATQTAQVKTALTTDKRIDASDINVDTDKDQKTVTLKGTVPDDSQRTIAADIATAKASGFQVVNQLTIKPK